MLIKKIEKLDSALSSFDLNNITGKTNMKERYLISNNQGTFFAGTYTAIPGSYNF